MTDRDDRRVAKALQGVDFPADRPTLIEYAETRDADRKTLQALNTVPNRRYDNVQQVLDAVAQEPEGTDVSGGTERSLGSAGP